MTSPSDSFCEKDIHRYFDGACLNCGKEVPERIPGTFEFTIEELQAIYKVIEHQYIPYEHEVAHKAINRIMSILKKHELDSGPSSAT